MLKAQGLGERGILPGDVVYVYTGWGDQWRDPDTDKVYYSQAPGLAYDAARYLGERRIVAIGLDTPFIDPVPSGMLAGSAGPAPGTPAGLPFAVHHHMLTQMGIHHVENAKLDELARDKVWTSCTMILPARQKGAAGAEVRPVAVGPRRISRDARVRLLLLPGRAAEALAPRGHRLAGAGELVHFLADLLPDVVRQRGRSVLEARDHVLALRPVVEEPARLVPHQRTLHRIGAVTELEQRDLTAGLPHEEVEEIVVEPAPLGRWVVGNTEDLFQHGGFELVGICPDGRILAS